MSTIVVGIDFGTTYSGVSYGSLPITEDSIKVVSDWPVKGTPNANNDKVPTAISYDAGGRPFQWGHLADPDHERCLRWFKLLLEPSKYKYTHNAEEVQRANKILSDLNKSVDNVITDYLRCIWEYTLDHLARRHSASVDEFRTAFKLRVVLTTPAIWDLEAQNRTKSAAEMAGLPKPIQVVSEPEAATLSVLRDKAQFLKAQKDDCFVICDAGGGTVDLITYQIKELNPIVIGELVVGDGDLCGSVFLDAQFEKAIATKVGTEQYYRLPPRWRRNMMNIFELNLKRHFGYERKDTSIDLRGIKDNEDEGIEDETIVLSYSLLSSIFDTVYLKIQNLIRKQIEAAKTKGQSIKAILLAGGFGESRYLQDRLRESNTDVSIYVARNAWAAITRGATSYGLERVANAKNTSMKIATVASRILRHSYGTTYITDFDPDLHDEVLDKKWDPVRRRTIAGNQARWFLKRHDEIRANHETTLNFQVLYDCAKVAKNEMLSFTSEILVSAKDEPPVRLESDMRILHLKHKVRRRDAVSLWDKTRPPGREDGSKYYKVSFSINVHCGNLSTFHFTSTFGSVEGGKVDIDFDEVEA